ncbi:hypothetical protein GCM10028773_51850 [Spirosoma koreense]
MDFRDQKVFYESLRSGQESAFEHLYRLLYQRIASYVFVTGGTRDDTKTVVHETIIAFLFNLRYQKYEWREEAQLMTYVVQIARNKWTQMCRNASRTVLIDSHEWPANSQDIQPADPEEQDFEQRRLAVEKQLSLLSDRCRQSIELYYYEQKSMQEIAVALGWANEHVARNKKYQCLQKLRKLLGLTDGNI